MNLLKYIFINIIETILRVLPFPYKTGLIKVGNPDRNSPVILTCNYKLTVARVKRAVKDLDVYLLVANSKGLNVWCSSTGGHFTNHSVISVIKTSGIEDLVNHRDIILPQLAATGIEGKVVQERAGWNVLWGPVYAKDIPLFIKRKFNKSSKMNEVEFPITQRIEMAVMWAFPFSIIASILVFPFDTQTLLPFNILIWGWSLLIFISFPLYSKWFHRKKKKSNFSKYTIIFDFSLIPVIIWIIFLGFLVIISIISHNFNSVFIFGWSIISLVVLLLINIDLMGSTPLYKSGLHEERFLKVVLDEDKCKGAGFCEQVCPKNCFEVDKVHHIATVPRANECVQCGACIVQCPFDALYFKSPKGKVLQPESVRKYKLNLLSKRMVKVE